MPLLSTILCSFPSGSIFDGMTWYGCHSSIRSCGQLLASLLWFCIIGEHPFYLASIFLGMGFFFDIINILTYPPCTILPRSLTHMSGNFASPIASDTSTQPLPASLQHRTGSSSSTSSTSSTSTSTSGTPTTPLPLPIPTGTVSSDNNKNSASSLRMQTPVPFYLVSSAAILLLSGAALG